MKYFSIFLLAVLLSGSAGAKGHRHKHDNDLPKTEDELTMRILNCLQSKDSLTYSTLFPTFDTLWKLTIHNPDSTPTTVLALSKLKNHPHSLMGFDPYYNKDILPRFYYVAQKGEDSGIHWNSIVFERHEFERQSLTRDLEGFDKIATDRYQGYIFVRDMLGRSTYCITVTNMLKIQGYWYGGEVLNIFEASTIDEYLAKQEEERAYFAKMKEFGITPGYQTDTTHRKHVIQTDTDTTVTMATTKPAVQGAAKNLKVAVEDDDKQKTRLEVIDRKYYEGRFDNEIPVKLYIRYMRGECPPQQACYWDAIYKFGDQELYVKLDVTKSADGKWEMDDDPKIAVGSMELTLKDKVYTGTWSNNKNQTGYDVYMTQKDLPPRDIEALDNIIEKGLWAKPEDMDKSTGRKKKKAETDDEPAEGDDGY